MKRVLAFGTVILAVLLLAIPAIAQPVNDDLAGATGISAIPFTDSVDTSEATVEPGEPVDPDETCPPRGATIWYELTLDAGQTVRVNTAGSDYDTTLAVYTGSDFGDLNQVACNDDTFFGLQASLDFEAEPGVTYLIQVGAFGGGPGGSLEISIAEAEKATGKPLILKSRFKGLAAETFNEQFDEETGEFNFQSAAIVDGRSASTGRPTTFNELFVSTYSETIDELSETFTYTDWFGFVELDQEQYEIDKKLSSAWVLAELVMEGVTCTGSFDDDEPECTQLGTANVTVDLAWDGFGSVEKSKFREKSTSEGIRTMFSGTFISREADVTGGVSGDLEIDFTGAPGFLSQSSSSDFLMIRGVDALP